MKKKWLMLGSAIGISSAVMVTTGISAMAGTAGYDTYKSALKNTKTVNNVSVQAQAAIQDNGNALTSADAAFKLSLENEQASGTLDVKSNGTDQSLSMYKQSDGTVLKSSTSDVYYVKQERTKKKETAGKEANDDVMSQQVETVIDALVGNLKDYVTVNDNADGSKQVSIELNNSQLPAVVNAIAPIAIKHATSEHKHEAQQSKTGVQQIPFDGHSLFTNVPQLTQDIKIEKVAVTADINSSNYIQHQQADLTVSGKVANGVAHQVVLHLNADLSGFNSTTPDQVDLTGKQVQQLKQGRFENHRG